MAQLSVFGGEAPDLQINYVPHEGQLEVSDALEENFNSAAPASVVEIIAARGWGKTLYFVCEILAPFLETHPNAQVMWVAPTSTIANTPVDDVFKGINQDTGERWLPEFDGKGRRVWQFLSTRSGPVLRWHNGATVYFKSAQAKDSIVSKGYNLIVIDEAALIQEEVFNLQIMGTARKPGVKIFMITSPRGKKHWTYRIFAKGQDKADTEYLSFQQPWFKNPNYSPLLKKLMNDVPEWVRRQEYYAEFIEDGDTVFRGFEHVFHGTQIDFPTSQQEWELPVGDNEFDTPQGRVTRAAEDRQFVAGLDLAKAKDFTVITVMDLETGELVYYRRMNKEDYKVVLEAAAKVCRQFNNCDLIFDATGVGSGLADMMSNYDLISRPFVFTNETKNDLINRLILSVEYQEIKLPNIVTMRNEMANYTYTMTRTGKISYNAPSGLHDDIVISIALANWYRKNEASTDMISAIDDIIEFNNGRRRPDNALSRMEDDND